MQDGGVECFVVAWFGEYMIMPEQYYLASVFVYLLYESLAEVEGLVLIEVHVVGEGAVHSGEGVQR